MKKSRIIQVLPSEKGKWFVRVVDKKGDLKIESDNFNHKQLATTLAETLQQRMCNTVLTIADEQGTT